MYLLLALAVLVSLLLVWQWRSQRQADIATAVGAAEATAANLPRRLAYKRKTRRPGLQAVDDSREAAAALMVAMARANGRPGPEAREVIARIMMGEFRITELDAQALLQHADWILRGEPPYDTIVDRMTDVLMQDPALGPKEIVDLDGMLVEVSEAEGRPNSDQLDILQRFRNRTGVQI